MAYMAARSASGQGRSKRLSYVKPEYLKGHMFPGLDWQTSGYLSGVLWNTKNHIIRIIPGYDPETREVFRQNINVTDYSQEEKPIKYISDTFMVADTVQSFGTSRSNFVVSYEPGSQDDITYGGDTMISVFARNVFRSVNPLKSKKPRFGVTNEMRSWVALRDGILPMPKQALLVQALLFQWQGRPMCDQDGNPLTSEDGQMVPKIGVVSFEGRSTLQAILRALTEPKDPGEPLDAITNNKYGGLAELQGNLLYLHHITREDGGKKINLLNPSVQAGTKGWTPEPLNLSKENVYNWWTPWQDLISYMSAEEQALLLASEFGADSVNYLVGTDPIYHGFQMPDEIAQAGYGRYARFTDGVTEVHQRGSINVPANGFAAPAQNKPETPLAAAFAGPKAPSAPRAPMTPSQALGKPVSAGATIPKNSGVPMNDFNKALSQIKSVAKPAAQEDDDMASMASDVADEEQYSDGEDEQSF